MLAAKEIHELTAEPLVGRNRLRRFMEASNTTQEQLFAATGIRQPQISAIANGRYQKLPLETARKLSDFFGCAIEDLFPAREAVAS